MADKVKSPTQIDVIIVKGEVEDVGQEALELYFTNKKRCGGGEIVNILLEDKQATITFKDSSGMPT